MIVLLILKNFLKLNSDLTRDQWKKYLFLYKTFWQILKLLHPFIPYVTEYIYQNSKFSSKDNKYLILSNYAKPLSVAKFKEDYLNQDKKIETIKLLRQAKVERKIASNIKVQVYFENLENLDGKDEIQKLALVELTNQKGEGTIVYSPLGEFILLDEKKDKNELIKELEAEIAKVKFEVERSQKMLSNEKFIQKAPKDLVEQEKTKLEKNQNTLSNLMVKLNSIK